MNQEDIVDIYRLSPIQQGILFHSLYTPETGVYVEQYIWPLPYAIDIAAFARAWQRLIERHAVLRTSFFWEDLDEPLQVVHRRVDVPFVFLDWRDLPSDEQESRIEAYLAADRRKGFQFNAPPLLRLSLIQLADDEFRFVWSYHHILLDGWSVSLLLGEVLAVYEALHNRQQPQAKRVRPYRDYITWLREQDLDRAEEFWRDTLRGFRTPTPLGIDTPVPAPIDESTRYTEQSLVFSLESTAALLEAARQHHLTLSTIVQGAWALLLSRYSGESDIVYGVTVSGRSPKLAGSDAMIGVFINTLPLRVQIQPAAALATWLEQIQGHLAELRQYEHSPLLDVQQWSDLPRGTSLFESIVVIENFPFESAERNRSLQLLRRTNYPLTIIAESRPNLIVDISYDRQRFDDATIARVLGHLRTVLDALIADPMQRLGDISILTVEERHQLLVEWNATTAEYPQRGDVCDPFEAQAARTPDAIAVVGADRSLSYAELNRRSNQLAHQLRALGVGPDVCVGLCVERSPDLMIGVLGILKAGGAYLPLDPAYPLERLEYMLHDARALVLLTQERLRERLPSHGLHVRCLDTDWPTIAEQPDDNPRRDVDPDHLAYVIYTSGSTGWPKGISMPHRALMNLIAWGLRDSTPGQHPPTTVQFAPISFDASFQEMFATWYRGGRLVMISEEIRRDSVALLHVLREHAVEWMFLPFVALQQLAEVADSYGTVPGGIRDLLTAGEQLQVTRQIVRLFEQLPGARLQNYYGPSETHVCTAHILAGDPHEWPALPPIGRPIANTQIYLLDRQLQPVPVGVAGEVYIGGVCLARDYCNRPDLTAEKYVPDPFGGSGGRLYKSGDLARYRPDGTIQFLGRIDHQVKIRGFRVELGEVEAVLNRHPAIQDAVVVAREDLSPAGGHPQKRLVAYVVEQGNKGTPEQKHKGTGQPEPETWNVERGTRNSELRAYLKEHLPEYMVPSVFVVLPALPVTPSGKVDRKALPAPDQGSFETTGAFVAPRTPTEQMVAGIWASILGVERAGLHDNFFELGGHSLLATQVITRVRDAFEVELPLRAVFEAPTVAGLAERIDAARTAAVIAAAPPLVPVPREQPLPLSFAQQRLWFLDQLVPGNPFYNVPAAVRLIGRLDEAALARSLSQIVRRHEALRTTFMARDGAPVQVITPDMPIPLPVVDLRALPEAARDDRARQLATAEAQQPFDLAHGPVLRATLLRLSDTDHIVLLTMHHIVSDGWSMGILIRELAALYSTFAGIISPHGANDLPPLLIQYADFAVWQRQWLQGAVLEQQLSYWKEHLGGELPVLELPTDHPRPPVQSFRGSTQRFVMPRALHDALIALSQRESATLYMTLLAAWQTLLYRYSGQDDLLVSSPIANRTRQETEPLIGFFVNTLVLRTDLSGNPSFRELLLRVREVALGAYMHQDLPFEYLVEQLHPDRDLSRQPIFQVAFALQNAPLPPLNVEDLTFMALDVDSGTSKFDLTMFMWERADGLGGALEYSTDLFDDATIARMLRHFQTLLEGIVADPAQPIGRLPLLAEPERERVLTAWNAMQADRAVQPIHALIEAQAERTPAARAVVFHDRFLSYDELNRRANHLAHELRALGVGPDTRVGVCVERSIEMVVGVLGVLKAGGAYVPIDPAYPRERIQFMLDDAQAPVLLTQSRLQPTLPQTESRIVCLDTEWERIAGQPATNPVCHVDPYHLAYVIYTSGSTGWPKGVLIAHRGLCNLVWEQIAAFGIVPESRVLQFASLSFDASASEIFTTLVAGASLHLAERELILSRPALLQFLRDSAITVATLPPSMLTLLPSEEVPGLQTVISAGESCPAELARQWSAGHRFVNAYGPTEATIGPTLYHVTALPADVTTVPIGRPIANIRAYVLDPYGEPVPLGVPGELHIGGVGLARGYHNRPALTAERFIPDPFGGEPGSRLYRTGDRVRLLPDGNLEYLGRIDDQVKVRGFRIELDEIAAALRQHPAVREAVVTTHGAESGERRLVAYVVAEQRTTFKEQSERQELETRSSELETQNAEQITQWQQLFEETYREVGPQQDPTFNTSGWNSSYSGLPIPDAQMRVWVEQTVTRIKALRPRRVLELGCGTGLLLFRIAPECERYVGTDFSRAALHSVQQQAAQSLPQVTLLQRTADDFSGIEPGSFDTVIINSVVQYFPSGEYLLRVLEGAVEAVAEGGQIFIGDVRSLPLLEALHASVQLYQAASSLTKAQLQQRVRARIAQEEELLIDPAFFVALRQHLPQIGMVDVRLKRGRNDNELTRFRYDVTLHVGKRPTAHTAGQHLDWQQDGLSVAAVRELLAAHAPEALTIAHVPNARVQSDVRLAALLAASDGAATVGDLRRALSSGGVDPEDLWSLGDALPYAVGISWSDTPDRFDVTFRRRAAAEHDTEASTGYTVDLAQLKPWSGYVNNPLQGRFARRLVPQLRRFLDARLPEYMLPAAFVLLDALPLTPNGKIERRALPEPESLRPTLDTGYVAPRTELEQTAAAIWSDLLQIDRVGMNDNFFDLGGHSLLLVQLHSRLRDALSREISVIDLFKYPTISALSEHLSHEGAAPVDVVESAQEPTPQRSELRREGVRRQKDLRQRHRANKQQVGDQDDE
ncbi:MAG TPA: amino acid adenylation domain-containing protein [Herpetosiphonaceae bacterium]